MDQRITDILGWFSRIYLGGRSATHSRRNCVSFIRVHARRNRSAQRLPRSNRVGSTSERKALPLIRDLSLSSGISPTRQQPLGIPKRYGAWVLPATIRPHNSPIHLRTTKDGAVVLNAEDFYAAFLVATQAYFADLASSADLRSKFIARLASPAGGSFSVGFVDVL